jgi:hypothetical protein
MSFTPSGVKLEGESSMTHLGTKVTVLDSINDNIIIGCDIFVED